MFYPPGVPLRSRRSCRTREPDHGDDRHHKKPKPTHPSSSLYHVAFLNALARLGAGDEAPPRHLLLIAAARSSDPRWRENYFGDIDCDEHTNPVTALYEGAEEEE